MDCKSRELYQKICSDTPARSSSRARSRRAEAGGGAPLPLIFLQASCQVLVDNIVMGIGKGSSKKQAEQEAAKIALSKQVK